MKLFDVTVSLGGYYTMRSQAYGRTPREAEINVIASLQNNHPNMTLKVVKCKEVNND